jgi:aldehyde dehydrogenase (NAD+)
VGIPGLSDRDVIFVGGEWVRSDSAERIAVIDPSTEQVIAQVPAGNAVDVDRAVAAARAAAPTWAAAAIERRADLLAAIARAVTNETETLAELISAEMGAPAKVARLVHVGSAAAVIEAYAAAARTVSMEERSGRTVVLREPVGVVAAITPWNYPLYQVAAKVGGALAAGCTVVLKPSELAPLAVYRLVELAAGILPPGVLNLVCGDGPHVGQAMAAHPDVDMVSFTGSTAAGRQVAETAAATVKRLALELGGKSAAVLLPDLDETAFAKAIKGTMSQAYINSGQRCSAHSRILVPADRIEEAVAEAQAAAASFPVGPPHAAGVRIGPLVSAAQRDRVRAMVERAISAGARVVAGGPEPCGDTGYFVRPTVLVDVAPDAEIAREEVFGPVVVLLSYTDVDDAVRLANSTDYGLAAGVWGADQDAAVSVARRLRAGQVDVNGGNFDPAAPFGGYRRSGHGRELGRAGIEEFLAVKALLL